MFALNYFYLNEERLNIARWLNKKLFTLTCSDEIFNNKFKACILNVKLGIVYPGMYM